MKLSAKLVEMTETGTLRKLSGSLGISPQAVVMWRKIPPARVIQIHKMYGLPIDALESLSDTVNIQ